MVEYGHNWTQVETCDFISRCYDRDTLMLTLLNYGEAWLTGRMICVVTQEHIQPFMTRGWAGWGTDDEITHEMGQHHVLLEESPILEAIVEQGSHTIGSASELGLSVLFDAANVFQPEELVVIPLQLASRTKMLFLGEPKQVPEDLVQFSEEIEPLVQVADQVARQLEELIKLSKAGRLPPAELRIPPLPSRLTEASRASHASHVSHAQSPSSVIIDMNEAHAAMSEVSSEPLPESTPPQLHTTSPQQAISARHTQPIRLQRETTELPSINSLFHERAGSGNVPAPTTSGESTHLGTPLHMIHEGMSIDIIKASPPVLDRALISQLPLSPFEEDGGPAPQLERPTQKTSELQGVSIIEPIGIQSRAQRTLMGGFSVEDFKRAQDRFEEEESKPTVRRQSNTLPGVSTPMAQIIRTKKRGRDGEERALQDYPTIKVEAISREEAEAHDRAHSQQRSAQAHDAPDAVEIPSLHEEPRPQPSRTLTHVTPHTPTYITPLVERLDGIAHSSIADDSSVNTRKMQAIIEENLDEIDAFPVEKSRPQNKNWAVLFSKLESRDRATAFGVASQFEAHPAVLARLEEIFPGRLYIDRYQWTPQTLPPVETHGPVLATLAHLGAAAAPVLIELMKSESLEVRFYATFLMSMSPVNAAIPGLLERIFDRDIQTRKLAAIGLTKLRTHTAEFGTMAIAPLGDIVEHYSDDFHVEIATELLGDLRHEQAIPSLINVLDRHQDRLKQAVYTALMKIALQPLPAATIAWRTWHRNALHEKRNDWVLRALISSSDQIRRLVSKELAEIEQLPFTYTHDAPQNLRQRMQQELQAWFNDHP